MTPAELREGSFAAYPAESRALAVRYLTVLRQLPPAVCPSFLQQIRAVPTSFPAERASLQARLDALAAMSPAKLQDITAALRGIHLTDALLRRDWVNQPATLIAEMTAYLWASAQIDHFRQGTVLLFSVLPDVVSEGKRLVMMALGQGLPAAETSSFGRLRKYGILLRRMTEPDLPAAFLAQLQVRANETPQPYAHWYVDGGAAWALPPHTQIPSLRYGIVRRESKTAAKGGETGNMQGGDLARPGSAEAVVAVSYAALNPLRLRVLQHMQATLLDSDAGVEDMQHRLAALSPEALRAHEVTPDPVLQRFYTELFTQSSGPQVFSTSFVQWAGRELMRRARPSTLLLRYAPRQHHRTLDEMVTQTDAETALDPAGSLRDAEMGAYYTWLETSRIAPAKDITFLVWQEGTHNLLLIAPNAPAGTETTTPMRLREALTMFA